MSALITAEIATDEVDEAESLLRDGGAPVSFEVEQADRDDFAFGAALETDGELHLVRYDVGGSWSLRADPDLFLVATATSGAMRWSKDDEHGVFTDGPVQFPPGRNDVRIDGAVGLFEIQFTPHALRRLAADVHGVEHVRLGAGTRRPRTPRHAQYWTSVVEYAQGLFDGGLLRNEHLRAALKTNLAITLLDGFALVEGVREWRLPSAAAHAAYRRAVEFIEAEAARPIGAVDVAVAAGAPFPELNEHFLTQTGLSIAEYLRMFRVIAAHTELMRTEPRRDLAEAVVGRWGFTSLETYLPLHERIYPDRRLRLEP